MRSIRCRALVFSTVVFVASAQAGPPRKALLESLPDDIGLAIIANNVEKLAGGVATFGKAIGVDELAQLTPARLIESYFERADGLDLSGPVALAKTPDDLNIAILACVVKDLAAWRRANVAEKGAGRKEALLVFELNGQEQFAISRGEVLLICNDADILLDSKPTGRFAAIAERQAEFLDGQQVAALIDAPRWDSSVREILGLIEGVTGMSAAAMPDAAAAETQLAMVRWFSARTRELVSDARCIFLGASFDADGIRIANFWDMKSDSAAARYLPKVEKSPESPLRSLPDGPFVAAFGYEWRTPPGTPALAEELNQVMIESVKGADREKIQKQIRRAAEFQKSVSGVGGAAGTGENGTLVITVLQHTADPAAATRTQAELVADSFGALSGFGGGVQIETKHLREKIAETDVDVFQLSFNTPDPSVQRALKMVYGDAPVTIVHPHEKTACSVIGDEPSARARVQAILKSKSDAFLKQERAATALKRIAPDPQCVFLLDLPAAVSMGLKMAERSGTPMPGIKIPDTPAPLLAAGLYLEKQSIRGEAFVPSAPIKTFVTIVDPGAGDGSRE